MKTLFLLSLALLSLPAFGQEPAAVEPIRLCISTEAKAAEPHEQEFHALTRAELRKLRGVVILPTERRTDYDLLLTVTPLTVTFAVDGKRQFIGYAVAVLLIDENAKRDKYRFEIFTGPSLEDMARVAVSTLNKQVFKTHGQLYETTDR